MKIVTVVTFVAVVLSVTDAELTLLKQSDGTFHCIASGDTQSSALAWVRPQFLVKQTAVSTWKHVTPPSSELQSLTCDLSVEDGCQTWKQNNNILREFSNLEMEQKINLGPVLDHRWEHFKVHKTAENSRYVTIPLSGVTSTNLRVHVSILPPSDGYVLLGGEDPHRDPVYCFVIDGWKDNHRTAIRKCPTGVPVTGYATGACETRQAETETILSATSWSHYTIQLIKVHRSLSISMWQDDKVIVSWTDPRPDVIVTHLHFRTDTKRFITGYWKHHEYRVLQAQTNTEFSVAEFKLPHSQSLCLSIIYFNPFENREIQVLSHGVKLSSEKIQVGKGWQVAKLRTTLYSNRNYKVSIKPAVGNNDFFIGDIRLCSDNETQTLTISNVQNENPTCTQLKSKDVSKAAMITECGFKKYGLRCQHHCGNCKDYATCDIVTGRCDTGCSLGYIEDIYCKNKCLNWWGENCIHKCGNCKNGLECNHVNGNCDDGCQDGWISPRCEQKCLNWWGENCIHKCGNCKNGLECNHVNGNCDDGCQDGWISPRCEQKCLNSWGENCIHKCGNCKNGSGCNHVNGNCGDGCQDGWISPRCEQTCSAKKWGPYCSKQCGFCLDKKTCDPANGECKGGCADGWTSKNCDQRLPQIKAPEVVESLPDGLKLKINNEKLHEGESKHAEYKNAEIRHFTIQYKKSESNQWMNGDTSPWPPINQNFNLTGLKSSTKYQIRVILKDSGGNFKNEGVPEISATTFCDLGSGNKGLISTRNKNKVAFKCEPKLNLVGAQNLECVNGKWKEGQTPSCEKTVSPLPIILGVVFVVIVIIIIIVVVFWRRRKARAGLGDNQFLQINVSAPGGTTAPPELDVIPLPERSNSLRRPTAPAPQAPSTRARSREGHSRLVPLSELEDYVENSIASGELKRQHALFPRGQTQPWLYAARPENKPKNRYANLLAYDATRVMLAKLPGDEFSDYINANYIDGYNQPRCYIATQGPKSNTVDDFWRMTWQENVNLVVMLANVVENGKAKCEQYWPELHKKVTYAGVTIHNTSQQVYADYTFRNFDLMCMTKKRKVTHLHFTSWPDHGVPWYPQSVAAFLMKILSLKTTGPIIVHCSAGVGRTGTVILADISLRMSSAEGHLDPLGMLANMRAQRPNMVDNYEQYELVHLALLECLVSDKFQIECSQYRTQLKRLLAEKRSILECQFLRLNRLSQRDAGRKNLRSDVTWPAEKSRYPGIVPGAEGRVVLYRSLESDFINAVYVDGFRVKHQFIATQNPLPGTLDDFWHMLVQTRAGLVLVMNQPDPSRDKSSCFFWPEAGSEMVLKNSYRLILKHQSDSKYLMSRTIQVNEEIQVQGRMEVNHHTIQLITLKGWSANQKCPNDPNSVLQMRSEAEKLYNGTGPIVVTCNDGCQGCGCLLAISFVVEKMKLEQQVDVGLAVRNIRLNRPQFVNNIDQFEMIHQMALLYLETFETYANFT